jgi:hypothetical protein
MADYDDTDKGAAFRPFDTQQMILQGKINNAGAEMKSVFVKDKTRDGKTIIEVYEKVGVLFENDKNGNENAPDYTGSLGNLRRLAAWRRMKDDKPYMTFAVSDKREGARTSGLPDDSIPF